MKLTARTFLVSVISSGIYFLAGYLTGRDGWLTGLVFYFGVILGLLALLGLVSLATPSSSSTRRS